MYIRSIEFIANKIQYVGKEKVFKFRGKSKSNTFT